MIYDDISDALRYVRASIMGTPGWIETVTAEDLDIIAAQLGMERRKAVCEHEWVEYTGLKESYSFCKKCDEKAISDKKL